MNADNGVISQNLLAAMQYAKNKNKNGNLKLPNNRFNRSNKMSC